MYKFNPPLRILLIEWLCRGASLFILIQNKISISSFLALQVILSLVLLYFSNKGKGGLDKQVSGFLYRLNVTFNKAAIWWILPVAGMIFSVGYVTFWTTINVPIGFKYGFTLFLSLSYCLYLAMVCLESQTEEVKTRGGRAYLLPFDKILNSQLLFFLNTFLLPRKIQDLPILSYAEWHILLRETPEKATINLVRLGLVQRTPLPIALKFTVTVEKIKELLSEEGISTEGNKDELILRLTTNIPAKAKKLCPEELFQCSPMGNSLASGYVANFRNLKDSDINQIPKFLGVERNKFQDLAMWILAAIAGGIIGNRADDLFVQLVQRTIENMHQKQEEDKKDNQNQSGGDSGSHTPSETTHSRSNPEPPENDDKKSILQKSQNYDLKSMQHGSSQLPTTSHVIDDTKLDINGLLRVLGVISGSIDKLPEALGTSLLSVHSLDDLIPSHIDLDGLREHLSISNLFDSHQIHLADHLGHYEHLGHSEHTGHSDHIDHVDHPGI